MCTTSGQSGHASQYSQYLYGWGQHHQHSHDLRRHINLFSFTLKKLGIECIYVNNDASDEEIKAAFKPNTKLVFGETIANPALKVFDIEKFANIAP